MSYTKYPVPGSAVDKAAKAYRNAIIEECARAVKNMAPEEMSQEVFFILGQAIEAIRALKDK